MINCLDSESIFDGEFTGWLVAQGKSVFERVILNPETLADVLDVKQRGDFPDGRLTDVGWHVYEEKTGQMMPVIDIGRPMELIGNRVDEADLPKKYPRLYEKFGDCSDYWDLWMS